MTSAKTGVSIFFPCYNDKQSIAKLINYANQIIKKFTTKYEIIVIDDGSTDGSRDLLKKLSKKISKLNLIFHDRNMGYGAALISGFKAASYEWIFYTDGDGQYDISELSIMLSLISKDVDFINGIKMTRNDPTYRIVAGNLYSFFTRWLFWMPILDIDCDFRLIRKKIIRKIDLKCSSGAICIELVKKAQIAGATFRQVSVHHLERRFGISQFFRIERILKTLAEISFLWVRLVLIRKILQLGLNKNYNPSKSEKK